MYYNLVILTLSHPAVDIVTSAGNIFLQMAYVSLSESRGAKRATGLRRQIASETKSVELGASLQFDVD